MHCFVTLVKTLCGLSGPSAKGAIQYYVVTVIITVLLLFQLTYKYDLKTDLGERSRP